MSSTVEPLPAIAPLPPAAAMAGCVVLITADRRADQMSALFTRHGASVLHAPVVSHRPTPDDVHLLEGTRMLIAEPPDIVVSTTGIGFRGWLEAADAAGLGPALTAALLGATMIARGSKSRGAIQAAGFAVDWVAPGETGEEIAAELLRRGVAGLRVAVQHHGTGSDDLDEALRAGGADVVSLVAYRLGPAPDPAAAAASVRAVTDGEVDLVVFTSAPAVHAWLATAQREGADVLATLRDGTVLVAAVGPVTAGPLIARGVAPLVPGRSRLGAMVHTVVDRFHSDPGLPTAAGRLQVRRTAAVLDGRILPLTPAGLAVLRLLARRPGGVVSRSEVLAALPGASADEHAAEVAVSRLRQALGDPGVVRTVVKRGYMLVAADDAPR